MESDSARMDAKSSETAVRQQAVVRRRQKLWTTLIRQPDGEWHRDPMPRTKREANSLAKFNRILGGIQSQVVEANDEEIQNWIDENE